MNVPNTHSFTLIELLVVITIIVVLLALLTPALDKAIYQAELTICSARLDGLAMNATNYAFDHQRSYPSRPIGPAYTINVLGVESQANRDFRPVLEEAGIPLRSLICPLVGDDLIDLSQEINDTGTAVYANYGLFFGWRFMDAEQGMNKLGDRMEFISPTDGKTYTTTLMATDGNAYAIDFEAWSTHPDRAGRMTLQVFQNADWGPVPNSFSMTAAGGQWTAASWYQAPSAQWRGLTDISYAFDDGSVQRYDDLEMIDDRMKDTPLYHDPTKGAKWRTQVPAN